MYDNGLLKYYREKAYKDGFLKKEDIALQKIKAGGYGIDLCETPEGRFYTKGRIVPDAQHKVIGPEVLLSQIYAKAGINTAIYLPMAFNQYEIGVISNDVAPNSSVIKAGKFFDRVISWDDSFNVCFLNRQSKEDIVKKYFTERCLQQQTKMRILDTASYNTDRHKNNFFYSTKPSSKAFIGSLVRKIEKVINPDSAQPILADDVISIDYGMSGARSFERMKPEADVETMDKTSKCYSSDFDNYHLSRWGLLKEYRENELLAALIDKKEFAETVGSLDPVGVAQDIKETIGYEIEPQYPEFLARSFDEVAESLIQ